jgi:hypothetical protein
MATQRTLHTKLSGTSRTGLAAGPTRSGREISFALTVFSRLLKGEKRQPKKYIVPKGSNPTNRDMAWRQGDMETWGPGHCPLPGSRHENHVLLPTITPCLAFDRRQKRLKPPGSSRHQRPKPARPDMYAHTYRRLALS